MLNENYNYFSKEFNNLSLSEKILLMEDIWESIISSKENLPISNEQKKELDERLSLYNKNQENVKSWSEIKNKFNL